MPFLATLHLMANGVIVHGLKQMKKYHFSRTPSRFLGLPEECKENAIVELTVDDAKKAIEAGIATELPGKVETDAKSSIETEKTAKKDK